jgi:hypothetical protein
MKTKNRGSKTKALKQKSLSIDTLKNNQKGF